jgi:hypothetical protein
MSTASRLSGWVRAVEVVLLVNAVPAFVVLTLFTGRTKELFVWTVKPEASARLLAAMYGNAAILAILVLRRRAWADKRAAFVVFTLFSVAATIVTFIHLDPFLAHPRYFFVYWLANYFVLFVATPFVFIREERAHGGRLHVEVPFATVERVTAVLAAGTCAFAGTAMLVGPSFVNHLWPWTVTPLVARIIGVWLTGLGAGLVWALWDGDALRARPSLVQGLPTAVLVGIVPLLHQDDVSGGARRFILFAVLVAVLGAVGLAALRGGRREGAATQRIASRSARRHSSSATSNRIASS